jgi:hypothetical protein
MRNWFGRWMTRSASLVGRVHCQRAEQPGGRRPVVPNSDAPGAGLIAGETVLRRFTNIWKNEAGTWRLFARHANVIPRR